jgi:hypothetical protein
MPPDSALPEDATLTLDDTPAAGVSTVDTDAVITQSDAAIAALPAEDWDLDALAASLGNDPVAAFTFVRDRIGFDPYPGVLRGADGTLAARSGNSLDRALLLEALLDRMGLTARFAEADLPKDVAAQVFARSFERPVDPLDDGSAWAMSPSLASAVAERARRDNALLRTSLDPVLAQSSTTPTGEAGDVADVTHHAWVQVQQNGTWEDLDPTMPGAQPGTTLAAATSTPDALAEGDQQTITLSVIVETVSDDGLTTSTVLEQRLDAASAADSQLLLTFQVDPNAGDGGGLLSGGGPPTSFVPVLYVDGTPTTGQAFTTADTGGGGFGGFGGLSGGAGGALSAIYLDMEIDRPGRDPATHRSVLLDRVPPTARSGGNVTPDNLTDLPTSDSGPLAFDEVHHIMVSTGASSPLDAAWAHGRAAIYSAAVAADPQALQDTDLTDLLWPLTTSDRALVLASEHAIVPALDDSAVRAFIGEPRVFVMSNGSDGASPSGQAVTVDLAADTLDVLAAPGAPQAAVTDHQVWYGALESALETELGLRLAGTFDPAGLVVHSTSLAMGPPLVLLEPSAAGNLAPATETGIRDSLAAGDLVAVPGDPSTSNAWWSVDPSTGATRAVLAPGLGGIKIGGPKPPLGPKPVNPPEKLPNKPPPKEPTPPQKGDRFDPPKPGGQSGHAGEPPPPKCPNGNEYSELTGCVSIGTIAVVTFTSLVGLAAIGALIALIVGY